MTGYEILGISALAVAIVMLAFMGAYIANILRDDS
jgi:hypothetical protein